MTNDRIISSSKNCNTKMNLKIVCLLLMVAALCYSEEVNQQEVQDLAEYEAELSSLGSGEVAPVDEDEEDVEGSTSGAGEVAAGDEVSSGGGEVDDDGDDVAAIEKRGLFSRLCGHCSSKAKSPIQLPCFKLKWQTYMKKSRCGWWRRRHTCYKKRRRLVKVSYCCGGSNAIYVKLGNKKLKLCFKNTICGGYVGPKKPYRACRFAAFYFCNPFGYRRSGSYCYPK